MKKKLLLVLLTTGLLLTGCQGMTKSFGGSMTIKLDPNVKLESITWKDNDLWYCTRPMREDEVAEVYTYQEQSEFGLLEGTITIIETKKE